MKEKVIIKEGKVNCEVENKKKSNYKLYTRNNRKPWKDINSFFKQKKLIKLGWIWQIEDKKKW